LRPATDPTGQAVLEWLISRISELEFCEHDPEGFAMWISTRPGQLLCRFCYQAAQVLAQDVRCPAFGQQAGDPDQDAIVLAKVTDWLGAHLYLCGSAQRRT
jgi:hypothetical protein